MKHFSLIILLTFSLIACNKDYEMAEGTPECMNGKLQSNHDACGSGSESSDVYEYEFQGDFVYLIDRKFTNAQECLYGNPIFNSSCEKIGTLWQGSLTGEINGESWSNAVLVRRVYPN